VVHLQIPAPEEEEVAALERRLHTICSRVRCCRSSGCGDDTSLPESTTTMGLGLFAVTLRPFHIMNAVNAKLRTCEELAGF